MDLKAKGLICSGRLFPLLLPVPLFTLAASHSVALGKTISGHGESSRCGCKSACPAHGHCRRRQSRCRRHRSSASMVKTGDFAFLVTSQWCRRLTCAFHMRVESCLTLSAFHGPHQLFRRGQKRFSGVIRGKEGRGGKRMRRILQLIGVVVLHGCPEGQVVGNDLA